MNEEFYVKEEFYVNEELHNKLKVYTYMVKY